MCGKCNKRVCNSRGNFKIARPFLPIEKTPFFWYWCDKCREIGTISTINKKKIQSSHKILTNNKKIQDFFKKK